MDFQKARAFLYSENNITVEENHANGGFFEMVKVPLELLPRINSVFLKGGWYIIEKGLDKQNNDFIYLSIFPAKVMKVKVIIKSDGTGSRWYKTDDVFKVKRSENPKLYEVIEPEYSKGKLISIDDVEATELTEL